MPIEQDVPVELLVDPALLARYETEQERMQELILDIAHNGLLQRIGVTALPNGHYEIRWGKRRSVAYRLMGRETIPAKVYLPGEGNALDQLVAENIHRTQLSEPEECKLLIEYMKAHDISPDECSERLHVSQMKCHRALLLSGADDLIFQHFVRGDITAAVAAELALVQSPLHIQNMTHHAVRSQCSAKFIRIWRDQVEAHGIDVAVADVHAMMQAQPAVDYSNQLMCDVCHTSKSYAEARVYGACHTCWSALMDLKAEAVARMRIEQEQERNNGSI